MELNNNEQFGKYKLRSILSRTDYRITAEALDASGNKVFLTIYDSQATPLYLFDGLSIKEFKLAKNLHDEALPQYINHSSLVRDGRRFKYMVTKYEDLQTLREHMSKEKLSVSSVNSIAYQLISAVTEINNITGGGHYNITPDTVMVSDEIAGIRVHLTDLSHASGRCNGKADFDVKTLSPWFRAPETRYGMYSRATDIYAIGVLMTFMLYGTMPEIEYDRTDFGLIFEDLAAEIPVSKEYVAYLRTATNTTVGYRFATADKFGEALKLSEGGDTNKIVYGSCLKPSHGVKISFPADDENTVLQGKDLKGDNSEEKEVPQPSTATVATVARTKERKKKGLAAVAGMEQIKKRLKRDFVNIVNHRELAKAYNIQPPNIILYGPPGTGKTFLANKLAEECGMEFCPVMPSELGSIYIHGSQGLIKKLFEDAEKKAADNRRGCLIFIDEIDAVCSNRVSNDISSKSDDVAEMLAQLNTCREKKIYVIGATNFIDRVDSALLRTGRMDAIIYIGLPDADCREELFRFEMQKRPHDGLIDTKRLAQLTDRYTSSDIVSIVEEAARRTFEETLYYEESITDIPMAYGFDIDIDMEPRSKTKPKPITQHTLEVVIKETRPSVSSEALHEYERSRAKYVNTEVAKIKKIGFEIQKGV